MATLTRRPVFTLKRYLAFHPRSPRLKRRFLPLSDTPRRPTMSRRGPKPRADANHSLVEYEKYFGVAQKETAIKVTITLSGGRHDHPERPSWTKQTIETHALLRDADVLRQWRRAVLHRLGGTLQDSRNRLGMRRRLSKGLDAVKTEDEPTLIVFPKRRICQRRRTSRRYTTPRLAVCRSQRPLRRSWMSTAVRTPFRIPPPNLLTAVQSTFAQRHRNQQP